LKKPSLMLVILLLVSLVSMTMISQAEGVGDFRIYVAPASVVNPALDPQTSTIRPNLDGAFKDWTKNTVVIRPNDGGTYTGWTGNTLRLDPSGTGTYSQWSAWTHLQPRRDGNWTGWANDYRAWDDWGNPDGDASVVSTALHNYNQTSDLTYAPTESRVLNIDKVRVNVVARQTTGDENMTMMLCTVLNANASGREEDAAWNGWTRVGSSPWLDKEDYNTKYIYTSVTGDKIGNFTFLDVPTGITWWPRPTGGVQVRFRIWQSLGGDDTVKIYLYDGTSWNPTPFIFSQGPPQAVADPVYAAYRDVEATSYLNTIAKINAAKMAIEKVTYGTEDTIYIDCACIRLLGVTTSSSFGSPIKPGTTYTHYYSDWSTNPITGSTWTWPDIDILQAGVKSVQVGTTWTGELRVTQLYVGVLTSQGPYTYWNKPDLGPNGGDADYFTATADAKRQSSALPNPTAGGTIAKVKVSIVARTNITTDEKIQLMVAVSPFEFKANAIDSSLPTGWRDWTEVPSGNTGTWLNNADYPSNYIWTSTNGAQEGPFPFGDVPSGTTCSAVKLRLKTWQTGGDGSDSISIEVSPNNGGTWFTAGVVTPTSTAAPGDYKEIDVYTWLNSEATINGAQIRLTKVTSGGADTIGVDHAYLYLSGVACFGVETPLTTTYTEYTSEWLTSPATGLAWTWPDIDNLEVGVKSVMVTGSWTGEIRVTQLYVKVIEAQTHQNWDDTTPDGDATYLSAISDGLDQSSQLTDTTDPGWTPKRVQVTIVARTDIETDEWVQIMLVIGTTQYLGEIHFPSTSYATYSSSWETNPATLGSWDWSAINGMQAGVKSIVGGTSWAGEIRVTQLYVVVGQDGTYDDWNDVTPDGDATYVSATMGLMQESSQLEDVTQSWNIGRVRVVIVAKTDVASDEKVQPTLIIGGNAYPASPISLSTSYATHTADWGKNPSSKTFWEWSDITNLEVGVTSIQTGNEWTGEIRVTQLYVEIAGPRFTVDIKVENVVDLSTYTFKLKYNTAVTSATGIIPGSFFSPITYTWAEEINDAEGYVTHSVTGAGGWLDAADWNAKYIYQTSGATNYRIGNFVFANVSTGITWTTVTLRLKTWKSGDIGGSDYMNISLYDGSVWSSEYKVTPPTAAAPGSYIDTVVTSFLSDGAKINATQMRIKKVTVGTADTIYVDHAQLRLSGGVSGSIDLNVDGRLYDAFWNGWTRIGTGRIGSGTLATIIFLVDYTGATTLDLCVIDLVDPTLEQIHWILGDVDGDRTVDISDLSDLSNAYGSSASECDFNADGKVDAYDLFAQGKNYTKTYSYDGYFSNS